MQFKRNYTSVMIVPTGIGAAIGGFAGDALPVARALSNVVDCLITHPNVCNYFLNPNGFYFYPLGKLCHLFYLRAVLSFWSKGQGKITGCGWLRLGMAMRRAGADSASPTSNPVNIYGYSIVIYYYINII